MLSFGKARLLAHLRTASPYTHQRHNHNSTICARAGRGLGWCKRVDSRLSEAKNTQLLSARSYSGLHHDNAEVLEGRIVRSNPSHRTINPIAPSARVREADIGDDRLASHMCKLVRLSFAD